MSTGTAESPGGKAIAPGGQPAATAPQRRPQSPPATPAGKGSGKGDILGAMPFARTTPDALRGVLAVLLLLSLAWGGLAAWEVSLHASAASSVAHVDEPLSRRAQLMYSDLADADVTITTSFLQSSATPPGARQPSTLDARRRFTDDLTAAARELAALKDSSDDPAYTAAVAAITAGLPVYQGDVRTAEAEYGLGLDPTGDSFMQVASEDAHVRLLPAAAAIYRVENAHVSASSAEATSPLTVIIALGMALAAGVVLAAVQLALANRTRRVFNRGLLAASALLAISAVWLAVVFGVTKSDLETALGQGAAPTESLALASIKIQQVRSDSIVNVIARSGTPVLQQDSRARQHELGPGPGSLLSAAADAGGPAAAPALAAAAKDASAWYAAIGDGYALGAKQAYAREQASVLSPPADDYKKLNGDVSAAITATQGTFSSSANAAADEFGPLEAIVIVSSLLMASASAWGLDRRLAEYR